VAERISTRMLVGFEPDASSSCIHLDAIRPVMPSAPGCEDCLNIGSLWLQLWICMTCGHVGCCDSSRNHHGRAHHRETGHPIVCCIEPGESWGWCFVDDEMLRPASATRPRGRPW
jgi:CPA2 family monovalent cation:H+ antiporter-2